MAPATTYPLFEKEGAQPVVSSSTAASRSPVRAQDLLADPPVFPPISSSSTLQTYPDAAHRQSELPRKIIPGEQDQHQSSAHGLGKQDDPELANIKDRLASEKQRIGKEGSVVDSGTQQTGELLFFFNVG